MVADVEKYPEFVPFCQKCSIVDEAFTAEEQTWLSLNEATGGTIILAKTVVGFKAFKESYISRVKCIQDRRIEVHRCPLTILHRVI